MSVRAARTQGEALAKQLKITDAPIDVQKVAKHLGLRIVEDDLGEDISGLLITGHKSSTIAVQKSQHINRKRFTIAHEIGHYCLRHHVGGEHIHVDRGLVVTARDSRSSTGADPKEVEANQFAACLLMPSYMLLAKIKKHQMKPLLDSHIISLAETFCVSEQAMTIRLSALGLL